MSAATAATGGDFPYRADTKSATVVTFCARARLATRAMNGAPSADDKNRSDVNRQKIKPVRRGEPDRAVVGPGRAIDGEAERVDDRPQAAEEKAPSSAIPPPGDEEQRRDVADCGQKYRGAVHQSRAFALC
jgi:hypothetical protein